MKKHLLSQVLRVKTKSRSPFDLIINGLSYIFLFSLVISPSSLFTITSYLKKILRCCAGFLVETERFEL